MNLSPFHLLKNKLWMPSFGFISIFIKKYGNPSFHNFAPLAKISQINLRIHFRSAKLFLVQTFLKRTIFWQLVAKSFQFVFLQFLQTNCLSRYWGEKGTRQHFDLLFNWIWIYLYLSVFVLVLVFAFSSAVEVKDFSQLNNEGTPLLYSDFWLTANTRVWKLFKSFPKISSFCSNFAG